MHETHEPRPSKRTEGVGMDKPPTRALVFGMAVLSIWVLVLAFMLGRQLVFSDCEKYGTLNIKGKAYVCEPKATG